MGYLCLRDVLSTKHVVSNLGHMMHPPQHFLMGFLKPCRLSRNMLCGYSFGICVWLLFCCVGSVVCNVFSIVGGVVCGVFSVGFSFARTNLFLREGLPLNAIIGAFGNIFFKMWFLCISFQCFLRISLSLFVSSLNWVVKTSF